MMEAARRSVCEELLEAYCRRIDARDFEGLEAVFAADCVVRYGDVDLVGLPALLDYLKAQLVGFAETRHDLGQVEERAADTTLAKIVAWHRFHPRKGRTRPDLTLHGRFESRFVETPAGLRIASHLGSEDRREEGA